jgi:uncharacterized Zn-binding protein involved in type VI secretion
MSFPAARLGDITASGDAIVGPGVMNVLIGGIPAAVVGDTVSGAAVVGAIMQGSNTVLIGGRPAARITSMVTGSNPASGAPVTTMISKGEPTVLIGG